MPCHPARARELMRAGKAVRRFERGVFYIRLTEREAGETQPIAVGIDPGVKVGAHTVPDHKEILYIVPLRFHRRQLHVLQPAKGGVRKCYGGTRSLGFKRSAWVQHSKYGVCYIGGTMAVSERQTHRSYVSLHRQLACLSERKRGGFLCRLKAAVSTAQIYD